ncbi:2-phospho-L-lactate guanylyltransferase [Microbacterium sp. 1P10UB]|uniref:2-phospho-L-lactate guanylyltransferase n=1 Tax=unclassified Microbacterium TaxID=2609290 RepID=UPI00399F279D
MTDPASGEAAGGTADGATSSAVRWAVVIPVKPAAVGKSRLADGLPDGVDRVALARAIALDTIAAAAQASRVDEVVVVTADDEVDAAASALDRVRVVRETEPRGLDAAVAAGVAAAGATGVAGGGATGVAGGVAPGRWRAALLGDLPALAPGDLAAALARGAAVERGVVADYEGTGSTLITAGPGVPWVSAFGVDSFARHRAQGFVALDVSADSTLRRDVDTAAHLSAAALLGVGSRTAAVLGTSLLPGPTESLA